MKKQLSCFLTALRFLTIIPVKWSADRDHDYFNDCVKYFVVVGLLISVSAVACSKILSSVLPHQVLCCFSLLFLAAISGFLHIDGLADTADGFFSARPRERILEIMHDSRTGSMGVVLLVFVLLIKYSALSSLSTNEMLTALFFMPAAGRLAIVLAMAFFPYARKDGGLGKMFYMKKGWFVPFAAIALFTLSGSVVSLHFAFISLLAIVSITLSFGLFCMRIIGGTTGDTLGATCELTEAGVAIVLSVILTP